MAALVREHRPERLGGAELDVSDVGFGAAVALGSWAAVLIDSAAERSVGPALLWAERGGVSEVELWVQSGAGEVARRAALFGDPPAVWRLDGRQLVPVEPAARRLPPPHGDEVEPFLSLLREAGTTIVDDYGVMVGEYEGLEVARVVAVAGEAWLEVGVGQVDRQFEGAFHGQRSSVQRIRRVVEVVREHRAPGAALHPLNRLGRERWLRAHLVAQPGLVGAARLEPVPPLRPRQGLNDALPAPAVGTDLEGRPVVVVASVGVDLDLVPEAADLRDRHDPGARLVVALPPRDRIPPVERLVARLRGDNEIRLVEPPWSAR